MSHKLLDLSGLQRFFNKLKDIIPTKTSELQNDSGYITQSDTVDSTLSSTSEKAVQNKVIKQALDSKANDNSVVHTTGNESVSGTKSFNSDLNLNYSSIDVDDIVDSLPGTGSADTFVHLIGAETINGIKSFPDGIVANVSGTATPLAHTHTTSDITNLSIPSKVSDLTNDSGYITGVSWNDVSGKPSSFTPSSHTHGSITNDGKLGTAANKPLITGANGVITTGSFGTSANTFCQGNDSRLSDARTPLSHTHGNSDITSLDASKITSGTIDIARLPKGALERLVTVADQTARFALTSNDVQLGDTVKQLDTGVMYIVSDDSKLSSADGYTEYTAGSATSVPWSGVTGKPSSYTPSSHTHGNITNDGKLGTASKVLISDSNKKITTSSVSDTELGYLSGVTSAIQTQISGKANASHTHSASDITSGLATVATSGSYNDLSNKPTIPTVNNATLTIQKNGTTVKTFTANASSNVTANITVPTKVSELTNDSGYLTSHQDISGLSAKADTIKSLSISGRTITYTKGDDTTGTLTTQDNNTWTAMVGATSSANGSVGYVNAVPPKDGYNTKYLRADGTWAVPPDHTYTVNNKTLTIQKNGTSVATFTANSASDVTANITVPTKTSDLTNDSHQTITAGTDSTSTASPSHGGTFTCIDGITKDSNGHVTAVNTKTVTLPADNNTDTLVTQNVSTANENHPILLTVTKDATNNQGAKTSIFASGVKVNPSTNTVTATTFSGALSGNASSATQFSANTTVALTGDATGTSAGSKKGWSVPVTLANSGVTAGTYGPSADVTGNNNATISVPEITVDSKGRVTSVTNRTLTCKNNTYNVYNKTLTIQKNGTSVATFTSNSNTDVTANITVPTKTSELTNDSGFLTSHQSLAGYLPLTGGTLTGDLNGTNVYVSGGFAKKHASITKGTNPSATSYWTLTFADKNGVNYSNNCLGMLETSITTGGVVSTYIRAMKNTAANSTCAQITAVYDTANSTAYATCPTPDASSNDTKIATTAWVTAKGYLTSHQSLSNYSTLANTVKSLSISGKTITVTPGSGSAYTLTTQDTVYTHPTTSGNKHIPSGGSSGQFLGWDSDGTAKWVNNPNSDTLMTQNVSTTNNTYPVLLCPTANATSNQGAKTGIFAKSVKINPNTNTLYTSNLIYSGSLYQYKSGYTKGGTFSSNVYLGNVYCDTAGTALSDILYYLNTTANGGAAALCFRVHGNPNYTGTDTAAVPSLGVGVTKDNAIYTFAPTPATSSNDTNIATTAFVKAQGYLTSHQSLSNYVTLNGAQTISATKTCTASQSFKNTAITNHKANPSADTAIWLQFWSNDNKYWGGIGHNYFTTGVSEVQIAMSNWTTSGSQGYWHLDFGAAKDFSSVYFRPSGNNSIYLGTSDRKWANVYATTFTGNLTGNVTGNCSGSSGSCTGNAATATKATNNANGKELSNSIIKGLSVSGKTITYTQIDGTTGTITTQDTNTDTLMTQNVSTTNATYPILLCATADATANQGAKTGIFAKSVKVNPSTNVISASGFSGPLTGNVTGNCSGSSGSCTGNAATATQLTKKSITTANYEMNKSDFTNLGYYVVSTFKSGTASAPAGNNGDYHLISLNNGGNNFNQFLCMTPRRDSLFYGHFWDGTWQGWREVATVDTDQTITGVKTISTNLKFSTTNTRGTAPSSKEERGLIDYVDSAGNRIFLLETAYNTDKSSKTGLYAYKTTTATGGNIGSMGIGCDSSGNVYTFAPTPATSDNSTKIATTAFVKAQGYITSSSNITGTSANVTGTVAIANGGTGATSRLNAVKALTNEDVGTNAQFFLTITTNWGKAGYCSVANAKTVLGVPTKTSQLTNDSGFLTSHQSLSNYVTLNGTQTISGEKTFSSNLVYNNSLAKKHPSITKGTNPSSTAWWTLSMCDKNGLNAANNALGMLETSLDKNGIVSSYLRAYKNTAGSSAFSEVRVKYDTTNDNGWINCTGEDICLISNKKKQGTVPTANQDCTFKMFDNSSHTMFEIRNRSVANSSANQTYTTIGVAPNTSGAGVTDAFRIYAQTENSSTVCNVLTQNFFPISNNTYALGDNSHKWKSIHVTHPGATDSSNLVATTAWVRARVKDIISGGGSTSAGGISPVEGTIISGFAESDSVTYSTTFGGVLTSPTYLYYATCIYNTSDSTMAFSKGPAVGGSGTWKLMGGGLQNPGTKIKLLFGLWVKVA